MSSIFTCFKSFTKDSEIAEIFVQNIGIHHFHTLPSSFTPLECCYHLQFYQTLAYINLLLADEHDHLNAEYAYTMKVTEKCDIYSYGVVVLELLTGRTPVQPLDQGGDLVTWVRNYIRDQSLSSGILDSRLNQQDESTVSHMITVLKIALICTSMSPSDRPTMREVVLMLIESNRRESHFDISFGHDTD